MRLTDLFEDPGDPDSPVAKPQKTVPLDLHRRVVKGYKDQEKETDKLNRLREDILYNTVSITRVAGRTQLFLVIIAFSAILIAINIFTSNSLKEVNLF